MASTRIAMVAEPLHKSFYENERSINAMQVMQLEHETSSATVPRSVRLVAQCPIPRVLSCDTTVAHLEWEQPSYVSPPADVALPRLEAHSFQIEWAEVSFRTADGTPQVADDAWKPLPSGDVTAAEVKVGGLRPGRSYALRINVTLDMSHVDTSAWEITARCSPPQVFVTKPSAPSAVKPPLLLSRERKVLKVKWPMPHEPGGENMPLTYQLFMSPAPQGSTGPCDPQGFVEVYQGQDRNAKVGKLIPGARYNFWVLARNSEGFSPPGQVATYTTQATVPAQPEAPRPVSCTQSSITLQWVAPPGNGAAVNNYILERDEGGTLAAQRAGQISNNFTLAYAGPLQTVMVGGLRSGLHYRFRLRAENDEGASFWSESCLATPAASAPGIPLAVVMSSITQQSATVAWGGPADDGGSPVLAHEVEIQAVSNAAAESMGSGWLKIFEGCITACTISSLQPGCTYRVRVRCANQAGWGGWCMPVDLVTAPDVPGAPGAAVIQQSGTTDLTLTWQPPRHNGGQRISAFLVELLPPSPSTYSGPVLPRVLPARTAGGLAAPMPVSNPASILVYRGEEPVAQVSGLQPGLMYQFRVQACNALGAGPWGEWSTLGTAPDMPSSMMPPCLAAPPSSTALRIAWQAPDARGAPVCAYVLQAAVQGQMTSAGQLIPHSHSAADLAKLHNGDSGNGASEAVAQAAIAPQHAGLAAGPWQQVYRGPAMQAEMNSLQPCTRYLLRVAAANAVGLGGWSPVTALTTASAPPSAPTVAVASAAGSTAISVMWQPPTTDHGSAVTGYTVDMMPAGGSGTGRSGWQQVASVGASECCALVSGLLPGRAYLFRVRAANACGLSPYCAAPTIATEPAPPSAPLRLSAPQRLATQAKVRWDEPTDCNGAQVEEYRLELACLQPRQPVQPRPLPAAADQQQQQNGLGSEPPAIPNGIAAAEGQQPEQQQQPELADAPQQQGPVWEEVYCGMETSARVPDLQPGCRYLFRVCAVNAAGRGPYSPEEPYMTALAPPGPPEGLEACLAHAIAGSGSDEGTHAVQLRWLPPTPCASQALVASYELHAVPVAPGHGHELKKVVGKATSFAWEELQPGLRYALRVRAAGMEGAGHGAWSEAVEMVMPGNSRGVTDSADSMSAASGTGEGAPLMSLSAMSLGKGALLGGERGAGRKRAGKKGGRQALRQSSYNEANDDALSVTSQAQSVRAGLTGSAANGCGSGGAGATTGVAARGNRVNTSKLTPVAVQKRPKTGLQLGRELKQLVTAPGQVARRAQRAVSKTVYRFGSKYMWHILAILLCAALAFAANYTYNRITKGPAVVLPSGGFRGMGRY